MPSIHQQNAPRLVRRVQCTVFKGVIKYQGLTLFPKMAAHIGQLQIAAIWNTQGQVHNHAGIGHPKMRLDTGARLKHRKANLGRLTVNAAKIDRLQHLGGLRTSLLGSLKTSSMTVKEKCVPRSIFVARNIGLQIVLASMSHKRL